MGQKSGPMVNINSWNPKMLQRPSWEPPPCCEAWSISEVVNCSYQASFWIHPTCCKARFYHIFYHISSTIVRKTRFWRLIPLFEIQIVQWNVQWSAAELRLNILLILMILTGTLESIYLDYRSPKNPNVTHIGQQSSMRSLAHVFSRRLNGNSIGIFDKNQHWEHQATRVCLKIVYP